MIDFEEAAKYPLRFIAAGLMAGITATAVCVPAVCVFEDVKTSVEKSIESSSLNIDFPCTKKLGELVISLPSTIKSKFSQPQERSVE